MKAEERKELETNALRAWMRRWQERMKGKAVYTLVGIVVLIVAGILIYRYWSGAKEARNSALLRELIDAQSEEDLDKIIKSPDHQGRPTLTWAKLQKARLAVFRDGLEKIGTPDSDLRAGAFAKLEEGKKLYQEIVNDLKDTASLQQEVYVSCARAEEALLGAPKADNANEYRGSFERMLEFYGKAAAINPDSEASKKYATTAETKKGQRQTIEKFYQDLYRLGFTGKLPFHP